MNMLVFHHTKMKEKKPNKKEKISMINLPGAIYPIVPATIVQLDESY